MPSPSTRRRSFPKTGVDGAGIVDGGGGQRVVGDPVDEPGQPARALEQRLDGWGLEQGDLTAGEAQAVGEVAVEFVAVEAGESGRLTEVRH